MRKKFALLFKGDAQTRKLKHIGLIFILMAIILSVGSIISYLSDNSTDLENVFVPGVVTCKVNESFDGSTKSNVTVSNTGNVDAYMRAAIIINWCDNSGMIYGEASPTIDEDYEIVIGDEWYKGADGYYYYNDIVAPGEDTPILIKECKEIKEMTPKGHYLSVDIISSAVQADPNKTFETWGIELPVN